MREVEFVINYPSDKKAKSKWSKQFGLNAYYSGKHWAVRKKDADYWHLLVRSVLMSNGIAPELFEKPVVITFWWNDNLDCSNHAAMGKMIEDAVKDYIIKDDSKKYVVGIEHYFHNDNNIRVRIREFEG